MLKPGSAIRCHSCNAIVPYEEGKSVAECAYCHAQVVLKDPNVAAMQDAARTGGGSQVGLVIGGAVAVVVGLGVLGALLVRGSAEPAPGPTPVAAAVAPKPVAPPPKPAPPPPPPKAWKEVLSFGELGTGPGMFTGPWRVAVTDDGEYFVAEGETGRVHKFDAAGKFVLLAELPPDKLTKQNKVFGMTADHAGHVWVVRSGDLVQLDAATGKILHTIAGDYPDTYFHGSVAVDAKNAVYATTDRMGDHDLVVFDAKYKKQRRLKNVHSEAAAVDGLGTLYVARDDGIDVLGADGAVKSRFAAKQDGRLIHVDDRGHFYVHGGDGVSVYEPGGAKLASFDVPSLNDFALARDGKLVALLSSGKVAVYELTLPAP